jgi:L-threonylcarbamoyladenylate synthase
VSTIVPASFENVKGAAEKIRAGELVAFPTETVYGLGANMLNESAVRRVFSTKGRPLCDPLIVHISDIQVVAPFLKLDAFSLAYAKALSLSFWPGPLTLVLPANEKMPLYVTGGRTSVAVRMPKHPVAQSLLKLTAVPIVAPSANVFGHVSPTSAQHVFDDFPLDEVTILDGGSCDVGIESTLVSLIDEKVRILRRGGITPEKIRAALTKASLSAEVEIVEKRIELEKALGETNALEAPGQLLTHYAPRILTFLVTSASIENWEKQLPCPLSECVVVDVGGKLKNLKPLVHSYCDIRPEKDEQALQQAFESLRWAESHQNAKALLLPDLSQDSSELLQALADRFFRASSGRVLKGT